MLLLKKTTEILTGQIPPNNIPLEWSDPDILKLTGREEESIGHLFIIFVGQTTLTETRRHPDIRPDAVGQVLGDARDLSLHVESEVVSNAITKTKPNQQGNTEAKLLCDEQPEPKPLFFTVAHTRTLTP